LEDKLKVQGVKPCTAYSFT